MHGSEFFRSEWVLVNSIGVTKLPCYSVGIVLSITEMLSATPAQTESADVLTANTVAVQTDLAPEPSTDKNGSTSVCVTFNPTIDKDRKRKLPVCWWYLDMRVTGSWDNSDWSYQFTRNCVVVTLEHGWSHGHGLLTWWLNWTRQSQTHSRYLLHCNSYRTVFILYKLTNNMMLSLLLSLNAHSHIFQECRNFQ